MFDVSRKVHDGEIWVRATALHHHFGVDIPVEFRLAVRRQWCDVFRSVPIAQLDRACAAIIRSRGDIPTTNEIFKFVSVIGGPGTYIAKIIHAVSVSFGVNEGVILGPRRHIEAVHPRFAVCLLADESGQYTLHQIGKKIGRDHTTVLNGIRRAKELEAENLDFSADINEARHILAGTQ